MCIYFVINAGGKDYRRRSISVEIAVGEMSKSFTIDIINDNTAECDEMFILTLSVPTLPCEVVNGNDNISEVLIGDDDGKKSSYLACVSVTVLYWSTGTVLSFDQSQYSVEENITPLSIGLMLSRRPSEDVIVEVTITDGSAKGRWCNNCWCKVNIILFYSWYRLW